MTMCSTGRLSILLALVFSSGVAAAAEAKPGKLTVIATPQLRLAEGGRAAVRVASPDLPTITASIGRIEGLREVSSGVFEAEFVPPDSTDPQVAFVTAVSASGFGWAPIALVGVREVEVAARPRTPVSVEVDGKTFGPVPASASGRAFVRVDVPPGVQFATYGRKRIELDVTPSGFAHVALDRASLDANSAGEVTVRVMALGSRGEPLPGVAVKLQPSQGTASEPRQLEPGVFEARWRVPPGRVGQAQITARVASRPPSAATATLDRSAGPPRAVEVDVDRKRIVVGEGGELRVSARVVDASGNPTDAQTRLIVSLGTGSDARVLPDAVLDWQGASGVYSGIVQAPLQFAGRDVLELRVIAAGGIVGTKEVALVAGPPKQVRIEAEDREILAGQKHGLRISLLDDFGNRAAASKPPEVSAERGTVGTPEQLGTGLYRVEYRAPASGKDERDTVRARVGGLSGDAELRVVATGGTLVIAPKAGVTLGSGLTSPTFGAELGLWTRLLGSSVGLVLEGRYFTFSRTESVTVGTTPLRLESDANFIAADVSLAWRRQVGPGMIWIGAGPGAVRTSSAVRSGRVELSDVVWTPSAHAAVSFGLPLGPGVPFAEAKGGWSADPGRGPVRGSLQIVTLTVGYRFNVF